MSRGLPFFYEYGRGGVSYRYVCHRVANENRVVRIRAEPGTPEFTAAYEAAIDAVGAREKLIMRSRPTEPDDHNDARWLDVTWVDAWPYRLPCAGSRFHPGWYVRRICPCHYDHLVTRAYDSRAQAERVMRILIEVGA
jgi:hypothetical protein